MLQPAAVQEDALRPWVVALQRSVVELRAVLADLDVKQWQLEVRSSPFVQVFLMKRKPAQQRRPQLLKAYQAAAPAAVPLTHSRKSRMQRRPERLAIIDGSLQIWAAAQVVRHGGYQQAEATVTAETTQLVVLPQPDGAAVTPAALLKAVARGECGAPALDHLRSRLLEQQLHLVTPKCGADHVMI